MALQKLGFYSIRLHARLVCKFIYQFSPAIKKQWPDATDLHTALDLANTACAGIVALIDIYAEPGV